MTAPDAEAIGNALIALVDGRIALAAAAAGGYNELRSAQAMSDNALDELVLILSAAIPGNHGAGR